LPAGGAADQQGPGDKFGRAPRPGAQDLIGIAGGILKRRWQELGQLGDGGAEEDLDLQLYYLNRSLLQLTAFDSSLGPCQCPEAYYLSDGKWVPNDATPLLWTQANLRLAMHFAGMSADKSGGG
jgi:hypothetical protein